MSTYQVLFNNTAVGDDVYDAIGALEVEENLNLPGALRLVLPVSNVSGDLNWVGDSRISPYANVAVVVTPDGGSPQCVFDGYVVSHTVHLQAGITASTVEVRAQDASVLMALNHKAREFDGLTDGAVANQIFGEYGFATGGRNTQDDSPAHTSPGHTLMQRGTDLEFLRRLARRSGRFLWVACGAAAGARTGNFAVPDLAASPAVTIQLNDPDNASVSSLDFSWDATRPSSVFAAQSSLTDADPNGVIADTTDSGLPPLAPRGLNAWAGRVVSTRLTTPGDTADLPGRAKALLRDAGWFATCTGTAEMSRLHAVLRAGTVVAISDVGTLLSGSYLCTSVRHAIGANSHTMAFTLARNGVGAAASGSGGLPSLPGGI